jgi:hypothetical protein
MYGRNNGKISPDNEYYDLRSMLGVDAMYYLLLGSRGVGKSYAIMEYFIRSWKERGIPFWWLRISETSVKHLLSNNGYHLFEEEFKVKYNLDIKVKGNLVYDHGKLMCHVLSLAGMAKQKGVAYYDQNFLKDPKMWYHICLDEFQLEKGEKKTHFDICYNFGNILETIIRKEKERVRIFVVGNTLEESSSMLLKFNYIPEKFGRYYIKRQRAVIEYLEPTRAQLEKARGSAAHLLNGDNSNVTNKINVDKARLFKGRLQKPLMIIKFGKEKDHWFTLWNRWVIGEYKGESCSLVISMTPYLNEIFTPKERDQVILNYDSRLYYYRDLISMKKFEKYLRDIRPGK